MKKIIFVVPFLLALYFYISSIGWTTFSQELILVANAQACNYFDDGAGYPNNPSTCAPTKPKPSGQAVFPAANNPANFKSETPVKVSLPNPLGSVSTIPQLIDRISDWLLGIATALLPLMIVWGAFKILVSGGKPETVKEGREIITYAVLGYALLLISKGIILIIKEVLGAGAA